MIIFFVLLIVGLWSIGAGVSWIDFARASQQSGVDMGCGIAMIHWFIWPLYVYYWVRYGDEVHYVDRN